MTKHGIYDEHEGFQLWNYMECEKDGKGRETWRIKVEMELDGAVVVPVVAGGRTFPNHGLAQVAGRQLGAKLAKEKG
ncbi:MULTISPECIES: hypothetical protein [unclassified Pseudomonas]|uniref:hypothetical protein n=1 Tax=unclassified Pseudomonas TaxID=196821 RepID=UPI00128BDF22|nr:MULTISPECIES: hypothetical protein [unclassified Pseudomonas]MPQ68297.1 hypothetical protein [Pseudomonas sp. MWU12-2323]